MKNRILPLLGSVALAVLMLAGLSACDRNGNPVTPIKTKLTADNIAKIQPGMTRDQVETLIGPPDKTDTKDFTIFKKTNATYIEGKDSLVVVYKNQEVEEKHSTVGGGEAATSTTTTTTKTN